MVGWRRQVSRHTSNPSERNNTQFHTWYTQVQSGKNLGKTLQKDAAKQVFYLGDCIKLIKYIKLNQWRLDQCVTGKTHSSACRLWDTAQAMVNLFDHADQYTTATLMGFMLKTCDDQCSPVELFAAWNALLGQKLSRQGRSIAKKWQHTLEVQSIVGILATKKNQNQKNNKPTLQPAIPQTQAMQQPAPTKTKDVGACEHNASRSEYAHDEGNDCLLPYVNRLPCKTSWSIRCQHDPD